MKRETEKEELDVLKEWFEIFGPNKKVRTDASGAHMGQAYLDFMDDHNIKLILVPKQAHYRMGTVERFACSPPFAASEDEEKPELDLKSAVATACHQRNRLRTVHASSPPQTVFGFQPTDLGLIDEPMQERADPRAAHQQE